MVFRGRVGEASAPSPSCWPEAVKIVLNPLNCSEKWILAHWSHLKYQGTVEQRTVGGARATENKSFVAMIAEGALEALFESYIPRC